MIITNKYIKTFNPCKDRMDNFDKLYPKYNSKLSDFLSLDDISYSDKIWLASRVAPLKTLQQWSVECAEYVLENFEKKFPSDRRVRNYIEVTKKVITGELEKSAARSAESAAWSVAWSAAESAAWSARSAAWSAESAEEQEVINLSILIALLKNEGL